MPRLLLLAGLLLPLAAFPARATDWRILSIEEDRTAAIGIDLDSVTREPGTTHSVTMLMIFPEGSEAVQGYAAATSLLTIDCAAKRLRIGSTKIYDQVGTLIGSDEKVDDWEPMAGEGSFAPVADAVCGQVGDLGHSLGPAIPIAQVRTMLAAPNAGPSPARP